MEEAEDHKFMQRCLELAGKAEGLTWPNPLVGAVVVHEGRIIGEGYHLKAGGPHAEVIAISSVSDRSRLRSSVLYVNLEPCSHFGRTPPCADLIISSSIPRVVIGTADTSAIVAGKGIEKLRHAGCEVITGVCENDCRYINRKFFTSNEKQRPYITLKWAQSADGFLDILRRGEHRKEPTWITGKPERSLVHKWRATEQAILVGAGTVRSDDPGLNVREWHGNDPLRMIISGSGDLSPEFSVFKGEGKTVLFTFVKGCEIPGTQVVTLDPGKPACIQIADYLHSRGIRSLFIEGGREVLDHFISHGLWDEARIFTGEVSFNEGIRAPVINGTLFSSRVFSSSILEIYLNSAC